MSPMVPRHPRVVLAAICVVAAAVLPGTAAGSAGTVEVVLAHAAFPTNLALAPDGRLFFTEKETGLVRVIGADGVLRGEPFASVAVDGGAESGLLGIALHPRFDEGEPWVYLYRSDPETGMNEILRVRAGDDRAVGAFELLLRTVPATNGYHNGGDLLFGPDGMLYVSVGEAHEAERAQDPEDLGGKVLRVTPEGAPAPGNPLGDGSPVFTFGHRNSFGLCADPATGDIWETENGPDRDDEVNVLVPGANYGWPEVTGDSDGRFQDPLGTFPQTVALTGCAWWRGALYVGSYNDGIVRRILSDGRRQDIATMPAGVTDLQAGADGRLYVATAVAIVALADPAATVTLAPTPTPTPTPAPEAPGSVRARGGWVALIAAVAIAGALIVRVRATRRARAETR